MKKLIIGLLAVVFISSCTSIPKRVNKGSSIVGIDVGRAGIIPEPFGAIIYCKLKDPKDIYSIEKMGETSDGQGFHTYLFDAEPGTYIVVGTTFNSSYTVGNIQYTYKSFLFFPEKTVKSTKIKVKKNQIVYMGTYRMRVAPKFLGTKNALVEGDKAQRFFSSRISGYHRHPLMGIATKSAKGTEDKAKFMEKTGKLLKDSDWSDLL